jgi:hypothetical protein
LQLHGGSQESKISVLEEGEKMDSVSSTVTRQLTVEVDASPDAPIQVPVALRYDTADPFAIEAIFRPQDHDEVPWYFARELLVQGLTSPAGEGDVRVWPASAGGRQVLRIALISPEGEALLETPVEEVVDFLSCTFALCPSGCEAEFLDVDRTLRALLAF